MEYGTFKHLVSSFLKQSQVAKMSLNKNSDFSRQRCSHFAPISRGNMTKKKKGSGRAATGRSFHDQLTDQLSDGPVAKLGPISAPPLCSGLDQFDCSCLDCRRNEVEPRGLWENWCKCLCFPLDEPRPQTLSVVTDK